MGFHSWERYARIACGLTISANEQGYASAIRQLGASPWRIYGTHVLPNIASTLIVSMTLSFPETILLESGLSFLGLGVQPPLTSLGNMVGYGREYITRAAWIMLAPSAAIVLTTLVDQHHRRLAARQARPDAALKGLAMTDIASHRGGALLWPENSRIAFENTARLAVEQVEFDVYPSRDGRLVVIHDATLDRTTDGTGPVAAQDWATLQKLVLRSAAGQRLLLLDEVIDIFKPTPILLRLEIKPDHTRRPYANHVPKIIDILRQADMLARTIITSFQIESLMEVAACGQPRQRIWLVAPDVQRDIGGAKGIVAVARAHGIAMVGLHQRDLNPAVVAALRAGELMVGGWGCNDADAIARMFALGVAVFTTDRPDLAIQLRAARAKQSAAD